MFFAATFIITYPKFSVLLQYWYINAVKCTIMYSFSLHSPYCLDSYSIIIVATMIAILSIQTRQFIYSSLVKSAGAVV